MKGCTVITSKDQVPYLEAWEKYKDTAKIEVKDSMVVWKFKNNEEAAKAGKMFMNLGFEYVRRV